MMRSKVSKERVRIKRAYEAPSADDGTRVLIDRLWPRGIGKAEAAVDHWMKEVSPSTELRKWFGRRKPTGCSKEQQEGTMKRLSAAGAGASPRGGD